MKAVLVIFAAATWVGAGVDFWFAAQGHILNLASGIFCVACGIYTTKVLLTS